MKRLPIIGVMGSGSREWRDRAQPLGQWIATQGFHCLTGGGAGVMTSISRAFVQTPDRQGLSIGILPADEIDPTLPKPGYPNRWIELPIHTHLPWSGIRGQDVRSRNHINILSADVIVALPGGAGTASEVALAVRYGKPSIAFLRSRAELPACPGEIEMSESLDRVCAFVLQNLSRLSALDSKEN